MSNIVIKSPQGTSGKNVMVLNKLDDATFKDILHNTILTKKDINKYLSEKKNFFFLEENICDVPNVIPNDMKVHIYNNEVQFIFIYDINDNLRRKCLLDKNFKTLDIDDFYQSKNWERRNNFPEDKSLINTININIFKKIISESIEVYKQLDLMYCSIDFLYYKDKYSFCEITPGPGALKINLTNKYLKNLWNL